MNHLIAAVGEQAKQALDTVIQQLSTNSIWQDSQFTKAQDQNGLTVAYCSPKPISGLPSLFSAQKSLIIRSRKSIQAFKLDCNAPFGSKLAPSKSGSSDNLSSDDNFCDALLADLLQQPHKSLQQLHADFTLIAHNQVDQTCLLAVSPFNPQTLFYVAMPRMTNTFVVSSNIKLLLAFMPKKVNADVLALWLSGRPNPHLCMYQDIHQLEPGTFAKISSENVNVERFWDINPNTTLHSEPTEELAKQLKQHIYQSVSSHLADAQNDTAIFSQMSGGMDSTSVSAIAHHILDQEVVGPSDTHKTNTQNRLHTISHTYKHTESCDESDNINAMMQRYAFTQSHFIELDKYTQMSFAELYPTHAQSPGMVMSPKYFEEAALMQQHGAKLLLTGNGGDEMFWGHSLAYYERVKKGDTRVISEVIKSAKELNLPVLRTLKNVFVQPFIKYDLLPFLHLANRFSQLKASAQLPPWLTQKSKYLIEQAHACSHNVFALPKADLTSYARYEGLFNTSTINSMRSYQAVFDNFDLKVEHPLFNTDIAEFSFALPQHLHISGKYPKLLLRQAMQNDLPKSVCWDEQKTVFDQHFAKLVKENAHSLRLLLQHDALADLGLLDNRALLAAFDQLVANEHPSLNVDLLYAILVQSWYQSHVES